MIETEIDLLLYPEFVMDYEGRKEQQAFLAGEGFPKWTHAGPLYRSIRKQYGVYQPRQFRAHVEGSIDVPVKKIVAVYISRPIGYVGMYTFSKGAYSDVHGLWEGDGALTTGDVMARLEGLCDYSWRDEADEPVKYARVEEVCPCCGSIWRVVDQDENAVGPCPICLAQTRSRLTTIEPMRLTTLGMAVPIGGDVNDADVG